MTKLQDIFGLHGKTAVITGPTRGIGRAIAELFAQAGATLVLAGNEAEACISLADELSGPTTRHLGIACDVRNRADLASVVEQAAARFGGVDVLVCNAGIASHPGSMSDATPEQVEEIFSINLKHAVFLSGMIAPQMAARGGGAIVLISSIAGLRGNKALGIYGLSKAALAQLARNLAVEWGPNKVRANAISPGLINTGWADAILANPEASARRLQATPLRRIGEPWEVAAAALYLASPAGAFLTGHNLVIDGGTLISDGN